MNKVIDIKKMQKSYYNDKRKIEVLKNIDLELESGKFYAIMGHSGCGKSSLINILGLIDDFDDGMYTLFGKDINKMKDSELSKIRLNNIGFVFQEFYLISTLKAYENVIIPMLINPKILSGDRKKKSYKLLEMVGLKDRVNHYPKELSGGEQQRVVIARALANNPKIILADEPTGNLDEENERQIFELLKEIANQGKCVIVVSHSNEVKKYADKIYKINKGKVEVENED